MDQQQMTVPNAWQNIVNVVRAHKGDANDHDALRTSLEVIAARVNLAAELERQVPELQAKLEATLKQAGDPEVLPAPVAPPS